MNKGSPEGSLSLETRVASACAKKTKYTYVGELSYIVLPPEDRWKNSQDFFNLFPGKRTIQTFDDSTKKRGYAQIFHFDGDMLDTLEATLKARNNQKYGIYMTVNETNGEGRQSSNVVKVRAVFADMDGSPLEPAKELNPSLIVETSPGKFHCYWFTDDTPIEAFTVMQTNIIRVLKSDPVCKDLPRVLRVPGFYHMKNKPFLIGMVGGSGIVYKYRKLVEMFPPEKVKQFSAKRYQLEKKIDQGPFKGMYGTGDGDRHRHILRRVGGMIKRKLSWQEIESEVFKEGMACVPSLDERELMGILGRVKRLYYGR
jgi:hypothetical protein